MEMSGKSTIFRSIRSIKGILCGILTVMEALEDYNTKKSFVLSNELYLCTASLITGIYLVAIPIIEYNHPDMLEVPSYRDSTLAKIIWIIVSILLTVLGIANCLFGIAGWLPPKKEDEWGK